VAALTLRQPGGDDEQIDLLFQNHGCSRISVSAWSLPSICHDAESLMQAARKGSTASAGKTRKDLRIAIFTLLDSGLQAPAEPLAGAQRHDSLAGGERIVVRDMPVVRTSLMRSVLRGSR